MQLTLRFVQQFLFLSIFSPYLFADTDNIIVVSDEWKNYSNKDGSGYYLDTVREIFDKQGLAVTFKIVPYQRSVEMINNKTADVIVGVYKTKDVSANYSSTPFEIDRVDAALSVTIANNWQGLASLKGQRVGALKGYSFDDYIDVDMRYKEMSKLKSMLKMLNHGRLDAVLNYEPDMLQAQKSINENPQYTIKNSVLENRTYAAFANNPKGQRLLKVFNQGITSLHKSGQLKDIMLSNLGSTANYPL
jgi:polar amino acid transport system substrate-binding protein